MEMSLGQGYEPGKGNSPAESIFNRALPNALTAKSDELFALARKNSSLDTFIRPRLLCNRDDEHAHVPPRFRPIRNRHMAVSETGRRDDSRRDCRQEDGRSDKAALRADARSQVGHRNGQLRHQRGALLSLLFGGDGSRPPHPGRCVCAGMPSPP